MIDTGAGPDAASGRFLLRMPPEQHAALRSAARSAGLSLNEYCLRVLAAPGPDPAGPAAAAAARASATFGPQLVAVVLHGSWARGDATAASDIDILLVLDRSVPITRSLYDEWDRAPLTHEGHRVEVHFVNAPSRDDVAGVVWLEAALDGVVVYDSDQRLTRYLGALRRDIASGDMVRRHAHGHPYWTVAN